MIKGQIIPRYILQRDTGLRCRIPEKEKEANSLIDPEADFNPLGKIPDSPEHVF